MFSRFFTIHVTKVSLFGTCQASFYSLTGLSEVLLDTKIFIKEKELFPQTSWQYEICQKKYDCRHPDGCIQTFCYEIVQSTEIGSMNYFVCHLEYFFLFLGKENMLLYLIKNLESTLIFCQFFCIKCQKIIKRCLSWQKTKNIVIY